MRKTPGARIYKCLAPLIAIMLGACERANMAASNSPLLEMKERQRWNVDEFLSIERAHISEDGQIVAVFSSGEIGYVRDGEPTWRRFSTPGAAVGVSSTMGSGPAVIHFRSTECTFSLVSDTVRATPTCALHDVPDPLLDAVALPTGEWLEQRVRGDSVHMAVGGASAVLASLPLDDLQSGTHNAAPFMTLGFDSDEVLLWSRTLPLNVQRFSLRAPEQPGARSRQLELPEFSSDSNSSWRVLRPIPVAKHWLVVLADLKSDRRLLVLYSTSLRLVRSRLIESPIGFLAANESGRLIAVSDLNSTEVILYCWRILGSPTSVSPNTSQPCK